MNSRNNMKPKERVKEMAKILSDKGKGYLILECGFFKVLGLLGFYKPLADVCSARISSKTVSEAAKALVDLVYYFSRHDASRFEKAVGFLNAKYPHAVFFFHDYVLGVANLTREEIEDCLDQVGIGFGYLQEETTSS